MSTVMKQHEGRELRGFRLKVYPTPEQEMQLLDLQRRTRLLWNALVRISEDRRAANEAWASKNGAGPRPTRPANDAGVEAWTFYKEAMRAWRFRLKGILEPLKKDPRFKHTSVKELCEHFGVKHDYQLYNRLVPEEPAPPAGVIQAMFKSWNAALAATVRGQAPPRFRKRDQDMPIRTRTGVCFKTGEFGHRPWQKSGGQWLNAQVKIPSVGWINARYGPEQPLEESMYWLEGVSIRYEADGWYSSIKQHVVPKEAPVGKGSCGIDVGLVNMFAVVGDDGRALLATNTRKGESMKKRKHTPHGYIELIAARQAAGLPVTKLHARCARHIRQVVREELFPFTDRYEFVAVEDLPADIGQRGLPHLSFMRTIRSMLVERYGRERVIEVDPSGTSRTCSMCGAIQPRSWSDIPGRKGKCAGCGHEEDSDVNAARNVLHKLLKPQAAE